MSTNMYTEYVFESPDLEHATKELQAILFNVAVRTQALLKSVHGYDFSRNSEEIRKNAKLLSKQADACSKKLFDMAFDLSEYIKKLDSYSAVFDELKTKSMKELISSMETLNNGVVNIEDEAIPYVPEPNLETIQQNLVSSTGEQTEYDDTSSDNLFDIDEESIEQSNKNDMIVTMGAIQPDESFESKDSVSSTEPVVEEKKDISVTDEVPIVDIPEGASVIVAEETPVITVAEEVKEEPVITSSTIVSDSESNTVEEPVMVSSEEAATEAPTTAPSEDEEILIEYDDSLSKVVDETNTSEEATEAPTTISDADEEILIEYDDSLSKVVDETNTTEEATEAPTTVPSGDEEILIEYDDSLSKVVDETNTSEEAAAEVPTTTSDEDEEILIEYDDSLSKVVDETNTSEEATEAPTTVPSGDEETLIEYDDSLSKLVDETNISEEAATEVPTIIEKEETTVEESNEDMPVELNNDVIEVAPEENDISSDVSTPLIPIEDTTINNNGSLEGETDSNEVVDLNSIVPAIPEPIVLTSDNDQIQKEEEENDASNSLEKIIFYNSGGERAILTTKKQITKLRESRLTQEALLSGIGFFEGRVKEIENEQGFDNSELLNDEDIDVKLEKMLEQANQLYKEGRPDEAQAMYDQISEINKQRQIAKESTDPSNE